MLLFIERHYTVTIQAFCKEKIVTVDLPIVLYESQEENANTLLKSCREYIRKRSLKLTDCKYIDHSLIQTTQILLPLQKTNK